MRTSRLFKQVHQRLSSVNRPRSSDIPGANRLFKPTTRRNRLAATWRSLKTCDAGWRITIKPKPKHRTFSCKSAASTGTRPPGARHSWAGMHGRLRNCSCRKGIHHSASQSATALKFTQSQSPKPRPTMQRPFTKMILGLNRIRGHPIAMRSAICRTTCSKVAIA